MTPESNVKLVFGWSFDNVARDIPGVGTGSVTRVGDGMVSVGCKVTGWEHPQVIIPIAMISPNKIKNFIKNIYSCIIYEDSENPSYLSRKKKVNRYHR